VAANTNEKNVMSTLEVSSSSGIDAEGMNQRWGAWFRKAFFSHFPLE